MPARVSGTAFGPGFSVGGNAVEFDVTDYGLRLITEQAFDGAPPWSEVSLRWQDPGEQRLLLEWPGAGGGRYAISVAGPAAAAVLSAARPKAAPAPPPNPPARSLPARLIGLFRKSQALKKDSAP
ncbi:MAG TPA: hypothetical protein VH105_20210 [Burkholderiales bacterium]|jgi:hypothetical protein|nr:hypothetical protein [Burkholderiales bacterium]